jgi:hypothetical protein
MGEGLEKWRGYVDPNSPGGVVFAAVVEAKAKRPRAYRLVWSEALGDWAMPYAGVPWTALWAGTEAVLAFSRSRRKA